MNRKLRTVLILAVSAVLLFLVLRKVGFGDLLQTILQANPWLVLASIALSPLLVLVSVIKWQILLDSQGIRVPLWRLFALYLVGRFFNNFMPTNVGGDVVRAYELGRYSNDMAKAMASVFMDRLTGLIMLVLMALVSFFTSFQLLQDPRLIWVMGLAVLGLAVVLWLVLDRRPMDVMMRYVRIPLAQKYFPKLEKFHQSLNAYRNKRNTLILAAIWSFVFNLLAICNVWISARAFHNPVPFAQIAVIVPVILVIGMMPVTFNGIGLLEWSYVVLFSWIGLPASVGLSTIALIRAKDLLYASIGGLMYPALKLASSENSKNEMLPAERAALPDINQQ